MPHFAQRTDVCPHATWLRALRVFRGCPIDPEPVTAKTAGARLDKDPATIRSWGCRYNARKLGRFHRETYFDFADLATIDGFLHRGEPVPATPDLRDDHRARRQAAA